MVSYKVRSKWSVTVGDDTYCTKENEEIREETNDVRLVCRRKLRGFSFFKQKRTSDTCGIRVIVNEIGFTMKDSLKNLQNI